MNRLQINDINSKGIQIEWQYNERRKNEFIQEFRKDEIISLKDRDNFHWYFERYIEEQYGANKWRALQFESRMELIGEKLFKKIFCNRDLLKFYKKVTKNPSQSCDLIINSNDPNFHSIPWELIKKPNSDSGYLLPKLHGIYRKYSNLKSKLDKEDYVQNERISERIHVLLVIARPYGERDIPFGSVAIPIINILRPFYPKISIEVLRPPTFKNLIQKLNDKPNFYNIIHFDGHGDLRQVHNPSNSEIPDQISNTYSKIGGLVFEKKDGTEDFIDCYTLKKEIVKYQIPLFILNACKSAEEEPNIAFSSVASQLLIGGVNAVIAMSYKIHNKAVSLFIECLYTSLTNHLSINEAVIQGKKVLFEKRDRESYYGLIELNDWIIPHLYLKVDLVLFPKFLLSANRYERILNEKLNHIEKICPINKLGFFARDIDILNLERILYNNISPFILLSGTCGIGKTELAFRFARWYAQTGGCPGGVFVISLSKIYTFAQLSMNFEKDISTFTQNPPRNFIDYFRSKRCLVILDDFGHLFGYPREKYSHFDNSSKKKIFSFIKQLNNGNSKIIILTRKLEEKLPDLKYTRYELGILSVQGIGFYIESLLQPLGKCINDYLHDPFFFKLNRLFCGHPLSYEIFFPLLKEKCPREILSFFYYHNEDFIHFKKIKKALKFDIDQFSTISKTHMPLLGIFLLIMDINSLKFFSDPAIDINISNVYKLIFGQELREEMWNDILKELEAVGILREIKNSQYFNIPLIITYYLKEILIQKVDDTGFKSIELIFLRYFETLAKYLLPKLQQGDNDALLSAQSNEFNFLYIFNIAEKKERWDVLNLVFNVLCLFYEQSNRINEISLLIDQIQEFSNFPIKKRPITSNNLDQKSLWLSFVMMRARLHFYKKDYSKAGDFFMYIIDFLEKKEYPSPFRELNLVRGYLGLGNIAFAKGDNKKAIKYYDLANNQCKAYTQKNFDFQKGEINFQLAKIFESNEKFVKAIKYYKEALSIFKKLGKLIQCSGVLHELGNLSLKQNDIEEANNYYLKSLDITEQLGLDHYSTVTYTQLGLIASEYYENFERAREIYNKCLKKSIKFKLYDTTAAIYHQLGIIAYNEKKLTEAEIWYLKALEIDENASSNIMTYFMLGKLHIDLNNKDNALKWVNLAYQTAKKHNNQEALRKSKEFLKIISKS